MAFREVYRRQRSCLKEQGGLPERAKPGQGPKLASRAAGILRKGGPAWTGIHIKGWA
jgi:hypothetical protein